VTHEGGKGKGRPRAGRIRPSGWARCGSSVGDSLVLNCLFFVKAAPKLDGSNINFQMLSAMGWEEGGRIGAVGGTGSAVGGRHRDNKIRPRCEQLIYYH